MTARPGFWVTALAMTALLTAAGPGERKLPPWEKPAQVSRALFRENCSVCHATEQPRSKKMGPSLFRYKKLLATRYQAGHDFIADKIKTGSPVMPAFRDTLTDEQIDLIIRYIGSGR